MLPIGTIQAIGPGNWLPRRRVLLFLDLDVLSAFTGGRGERPYHYGCDLGKSTTDPKQAVWKILVNFEVFKAKPTVDRQLVHCGY